MTAPVPPRSFVGAFIGIVAVFALLGPPVGGAAFAPLALALHAPAAPDAFALAAAVGAVFGHWLMLIAAYAVGVGPAIATGVLFALWDAAAPPNWPRALVAAAIGGVVAYAVALRFAAFGSAFDMMFQPDAPTIQSISLTTAAVTEPVAHGTGLVRAFAASGAVGGLVSAMAASLLGLTAPSAPERAV